eukprot:scaffold1404_cov194-Isochrysis_galbana.AAC.1
MCSKILADCCTAAAPALWVLRSVAPRVCPAARAGMWEYKLSGGAQLAPHRLYVLARLLTPPKGVWEGPSITRPAPATPRACRGERRSLASSPPSSLPSLGGDASWPPHGHSCADIERPPCTACAMPGAGGSATCRLHCRDGASRQRRAGDAGCAAGKRASAIAGSDGGAGGSS